jgi:hypothetical protein
MAFCVIFQNVLFSKGMHECLDGYQQEQSGNKGWSGTLPFKGIQKVLHCNLVLYETCGVLEVPPLLMPKEFMD